MTNEQRLKAAEEAERYGDYSQAEFLVQEVLMAQTTELERAASLRVLGLIASDRGMHTHALEKLEESLAISVSIGDRKEEAKARNTFGIVHMNLSDYSKALENYDRAFALHDELGDKNGAAAATANMANVYNRLSDYPKALELMTRALSMYEELEYKYGVATLSANIGTVHLALSDHGKALEYLLRALSMHEELGDKSSAARVSDNIGGVYLNLSDYPKALECFSRAVATYEELGNKQGVAVVTGNISAVYWHLSNYPKALESLNRALSIYEELGNKSGVALVIGNIGNVHLSLSDYSHALESMSRALSIHEELGEKNAIARTLGNIGLVYYMLSDCPMALEYMIKSLAMHEQLGDKSSAALVTANIADVHKSQGDINSALLSFEQALNQAQNIGNRTICAQSLAGIGSCYSVLKQQDKAREYLCQALELRRTELGSNAGVAILLIELGRLHLEEQNAAEAAKLFGEACNLAHELGEKLEEYKAHELLARTYELLGNIDLAYKHHKLFYSLKEEVQSEDARKKAEQVEQQRRVVVMERRQAAERAAAEATTSLLHKVLPSQVADRLLKGERVADYFQNISILFIDIVGFTPIAARMPAKAVLAFLNYVFGEFDRIMKKHGVQKIKTIGDGYMAVSGAPVECSDHAERLARAALELMADIQLPDDIRKTLPKGSVFHLRMGLHTGSAFAGIVGDEGFVYDVYSDAVNLAARMEATGEAGKIHCSEEFAYHLQNRDESFVFEERGEIEVKGKGVMRTYFLERA